MEAPSPPKKPSPFLRLPLELRQQIYSFVLPASLPHVPKALNGVIWRRGHTALLLTNRQISEECLDVIYGRNTFMVDIAYDSITLRYRWRLKSGFAVAPSRAYSSLERFSRANVRRIRKWIVNVEHVDSYLGMIKYNCAGRGLTDGLRMQVKRFVEIISLSTNIVDLKIQYVDGNEGRSVAETVLEPFRGIHRVRKASVGGAVTPEFAALLRGEMTSSAESRAPSRCHPEVVVPPSLGYRLMSEENPIIHPANRALHGLYTMVPEP
ncbi:hypothetical protein H2201_005418 [Coniosporium apollinis]|uniref:F-box domain-containing protein n=1 Tax=Coniosporium apollinis TaxID=61459 RepID=A0ABQ9NQ09_9PEZI|nr:hypothetical protein H2201_005418 [Coniosporium apollinis]